MVGLPSVVVMSMPFICTCWCISQDSEYTTLATAGHCVVEVGSVVTVKSPHDGRAVSCRVIGQDKENDVALLRAFTKEIGQLEVRPIASPQNGRASVETRRGTLYGDVRGDVVAIPGITERELVGCRVVPGDSGSAVVQSGNVVGCLTHSIGNGSGGFTPTVDRVASDCFNGKCVPDVKVQTPSIAGLDMEVSMRDVILAVLGWFLNTWYTKKQVQAAKA